MSDSNDSPADFLEKRVKNSGIQIFVSSAIAKREVFSSNPMTIIVSQKLDF
jgi:hypothetical protein